MATRPAENKETRSSNLSAAWHPFAKKLASVLKKLKEDQCLIVSVKRTNRFVQFAAQGAHGMRVETTSNSYLAKPHQLNERQIATLIDAGWQNPTGTPTDATPERDPDGSPNFFVDLSRPVSFKAVADLAVRTLSEVLRVPHPGFMQYAAFNADMKAIALPELGLMLEKPAPKIRKPPNLSKLLLATLKKTTGISDLTFDDDGDISIRSGSALTFVGLIDDPPYVRIYSPILVDVEDNAAICGRLNDINATETLMRFIFRNGIIYSVADVSASPFVGAHVAQAFVHVCAIADGMDSLLQEEFGGQTAFVESMPSLMKH